MRPVAALMVVFSFATDFQSSILTGRMISGIKHERAVCLFLTLSSSSVKWPPSSYWRLCHCLGSRSSKNKKTTTKTHTHTHTLSLSHTHTHTHCLKTHTQSVRMCTHHTYLHLGKRKRKTKQKITYLDEMLRKDTFMIRGDKWGE